MIPYYNSILPDGNNVMDGAPQQERRIWHKILSPLSGGVWRKLLPAMRSHAELVSTLKLGILAVIVLLVLVLILWPLFRPAEDKFNITFESAELSEGAAPKMIRPRFYGLDDKNSPYNLTADEAIQEGKDSIRLKAVSGDITLKDGTWVAMLADEGKIDIPARRLYLYGSVNLFADSGYEVFTESATLSLKEGVMEGNEEVLVQGTQGTLKAQGFVLKDNGKNMNFKGRVQMVRSPDPPARKRIRQKMEALKARAPEPMIRAVPGVEKGVYQEKRQEPAAPVESLPQGKQKDSELKTAPALMPKPLALEPRWPKPTIKPKSLGR